MKDMKAITTREMQQHTRAVRERLEAGESLVWMKRGRVVARLTPEVGQGEGGEWPDLISRLRSIYGEEGDVKGGTESAASLIYADRE